MPPLLSTTLKTPTPTPDSPGSSVFDLPTQLGSQVAANLANATDNDVKPERLSSGTNLERESFIVISGGTGGNSICSAFGNNACYVLPVSDDGGSSSEIIRVLGGPSIGDIRSRLVRLIPQGGSHLEAIRNLLAYRLPSTYSEREARDEWREIVEGRSKLWHGIPNDRKETIRGFLVYFESDILKRAHKNFTFVNGSIGNYFLAAAQGFFRSLPSAIFLFSSITNSQANILPVVVTNHTVTIAVDLENGTRLVGHCEISHPVRGSVPSAASPSINVSGPVEPDPWSPIDGIGGGQTSKGNVMFEHQRGKNSDGGYEQIPSKISRLLYINAYGNEILPAPNPDYISSLANHSVLVYSCGSLWTSIIPCLALRGVGPAIARSHSLRAKILLLNSKNDRETDGYTAEDYISAIVSTLNHHYTTSPYGLGNANTTFPPSAFITDVVYLKGGTVPVDTERLTALGVRCTQIDPADTDRPSFDADTVKRAISDIVFRQIE